MIVPRVSRRSATLWAMIPGLSLVLLSLLTVVWFSPGMPYPEQDSAWVLALNQAVADRLAFGRDVIYPLGPWGGVYAGQYHPATDGMMLAGGALVALGLTGGLLCLARGGRRWIVLLAPLLAATVGERDPVFVFLPLLLLAVAVDLPLPSVLNNGWRTTALIVLTAACALLTLIKGTFGTEAVPMVGLAVLGTSINRRYQLAGAMLACYAASLAGFWLLAGQQLVDLPAYVETMLAVISGYSEGLALDGPLSDILAYLLAALTLLWLLWKDRVQGSPTSTGLLIVGLLFTLFVAFKSGFVRHDEHALIAAGTLAMTPTALVATLRRRSLAAAVLVTSFALAFISHNHPGYEWPSVARGSERLTSAASGVWTRVADSDRLPRLFNADMAAVRTAMPLPHVTGPTDIYSSGQMILLANGLEWSPRPALQSVTVLSDVVAQADLDHLRAAGGNHPPVQNVFYRVESEDNRLRSTQDGLSWPTLLAEFRVEHYDRALDMALLRRDHAVRPLPTRATVLEGSHRLGEEVAVPVMPNGLSWATLDIQPTLAGRLASLLFRPPVLTISIRYANGPVEHYRLISSLARMGFLLTPRVANTEDMLWLLLPERRKPAFRPVSIAVTGESGTRWLWQERFTVRLQSIDIPVQDQVRAMLMPAPLTPTLQVAARTGDFADACAIELINGHAASTKPAEVHGSVEVSGWSVVSIARGEAPKPVLVRLTDAAGHVWETVAETRPRLDVAGYFVNPELTESGFNSRFDVSSLKGAYTMSIEGEGRNTHWRCKPTQSLLVTAPAGSAPE